MDPSWLVSIVQAATGAVKVWEIFLPKFGLIST